MPAILATPLPIFDNLEFLENPFHLRSFSTEHLLDDKRLAADTALDFEYAWKFIFSYNGSSATFNVYRREIERLMHWSWRVRQCSILNLKRQDIEEYVEFCRKPPLSWIGLKNVARFKSRDGLRVANKEWRPFVVNLSKSQRQQQAQVSQKNFSLSQAAIQAVFSVLSSFYNFLVQEEVAHANPVLLIRQKSKYIQKQQHKAPVRRISNLQWDYVLETVELAAGDFPARHERTLFIMKCLFAMYLRISELVADERSTPTMGDFRKDMDGNWWFHVTGKGNKNRIVTVSDDMLNALRRYRKYLGITSLPSVDDNTPLVSKNLGHGPITSTRQIRSIVQACFDQSYTRMCNDGLEEDAGELKAATVHWLRHTGISEDVKTRPREHVRDDAGHASMQTTDRYIESDLRERHASGRKKKISTV